jgi:hypothetical protein
VVVASHGDCLATPPPATPAVVAVLVNLPPGATATRAQLDELAGWTANLLAYSNRAWRECGSGG